MTPTRVDAIQAWLRAAYDQLGMRDYEVTFKPDRPPSEDALATTWLASHAERTEVYLKSDFWDEPADERRRTLLHEVLHAPFSRIIQVVEQGLGGAIGKPLEDAIDRLMTHEVERTIGKLEMGLAPLFPPVVDPDGAAESSEPAGAPHAHADSGGQR